MLHKVNWIQIGKTRSAQRIAFSQATYFCHDKAAGRMNEEALPWPWVLQESLHVLQLRLMLNHFFAHSEKASI